MHNLVHDLLQIQILQQYFFVETIVMQNGLHVFILEPKKVVVLYSHNF